MVAVRSTSSRSTTADASSTARVNTPSSDGDVFDDAAAPVENLNLGNLRLSSPTSSTVSDIYSATPMHDSRLTPATEAQPASLASSPSPSVQIPTPGTSTAPFVVSGDRPTPSTSSSSSNFPPTLSIDFSLSISTHGSPSRTPFQFTGPDFPLPSIEDPSTPPRQSPSVVPPYVSSGLGSPTPNRQSRASPRSNQGPSGAIQGSTGSQQRRDEMATIASQVRRIQIDGDSLSPTPPRTLQPETPSRYLSLNQDDDNISHNGSPGPSRPSGGRRRRSSSQMNRIPHNVRDEEPPEDDFNNPDFQRAFIDTREMMARLETTLGSSELHLDPDSTIRRLRQKAGELARFHCPPTRTVGFVGDSGVGKSSLLNSLLDRKGLACASSSGAACTCVVTEYHYHEQDNFTIHVDLFTEDELKTQLTEMVQSYRRHHLGPAAEDGEEQKDIADRAKVASDTFQAMFRGQQQFADGRFVLGNQSEERTVSTMLQWAEQIVKTADGMAGAGMAGAVTVDSKDECSRLLVDFTSERQDTNQSRRNNSPQRRRRSLWPFIKKIRVYLNAHILSKGLILVDLPGLRDLNTARQNITERYILRCDEIFVVCWILRVVTDASVQAVFDLARQARLSNVGIVCTGSDRVNPDEELAAWRGPEVRELEGRINRLQTAEAELKTIKERVDEWEGFQLDDDLLDEERQELERLRSRIRPKEKTIETLQFEQQRYLITTRNNRIRTQLFNNYKDTIPGGNLKVYYVSNEIYFKHREEGKDKALPWLELSGIIPLRKDCIAMVSNSRLRIARNYIDNDVRSLVSSVELWVQSGAGTQSAEEKETVNYVLDTIEERLKEDLSRRGGPFSRLSRELSEEFRQQIYSRRRTTQWMRGAVEASQDWAGWWHSTYSAFCRNYGCHSTDQVRSRNWNQEAMETMVRDTAPLWNSLRRSIADDHIAGIVAKVDEVMDWAIEFIDEEGMFHQSGAAADILEQALESRQRLLGADLEDACHAFETGLRVLWTTVSSSHRTSLMGENMEAAYNQCRAESGGGSDSRRKSIIRRQLSDEGLFETIVRSFQTHFRDLAAELQHTVQRAVETHVAEICETMNILRDENVITESERDGEFRRRVEEEIASIRAQLRPRD